MIAAKFGDPVLGIDIHAVIPPPPAPSVPTPLPHPFVGVVFDPLGAAIGAAMGAVFGGGGPVIVNGMPTGNTGTEVKAIPHIPTPPGIGPHPSDAPTGNEGTLVTGSKTVDFAGSSQSRTLSMVMSCNYPINLPTSVCGAVPMGAPVLIGGPEAVDFAAAATQAIRTKWVSDKLNALVKGTKGSKRSKVICFLTGHPVDVMTGELIAEAVDADLPGTIPLVFERNYRSRETESLLLGPGWYHFFDAYIEPSKTSTRVRLPDGRPAEHPPLEIGESYFHAPDRYTISREHDSFRLSVPEGLTYVFKPTEPASGGAVRHRLVEIRDRARNVVSLTWKGRYLSTIIDTAGREIACRYTREGKLEKLLLVVENETEHLLVRYGYGQDGQLAEATDPLGHSMRYAYKGGVLVREAHKGGLTFHFEWDWAHTEGWCIRTWGDAGESDGACMDLAPGGRAPKAIYDRRLTYDKHRHRTMVHDGRGGISYYEGNALELVEKEIDATGRTTKYEWNEHAWKTAEENHAGERYEWTYDARGNKTREVDPLGQVTTWTYDDLDRVRTLTAPNGGRFEIEYDRSSRPSTVRRPDGTATLFTRDEFGRVLRVDDPMGRRTAFRWSVFHTLAEATDPEERTTTYRHDVFGSLTFAKDPLGRTLEIERDAARQPTFVKRPDGEELTLKYDPEGNVIEQVDSRGRKTCMRYAGMGQLVEHIDPMGNRVRLRYDEELDLVGVENQGGDLYTFALDRCGRVTGEKTFSGTKRQFLLDKAGRTIQVLSGAYRLTKFERDALGRIVKQTSQGGNPNVLSKPTEETFAYDELGSLVAARTPDAEVVFERDRLGRILREHETARATSLTASVDSRYDAAGLRVERTTSFAHKSEYTWNDAGELVGVSSGWDLDRLATPLRRALPQASMGAFDIKIARDPLGQELARRLPGGVASVWDRDPWGRATEHRVLTGASNQSSGRDVARRTYAWASPEEIASISTLEPASGSVKRQSQFEYDPRGHLIRQLFSDGEVLERQSDPVGNLYRSTDRSDRRYGPGGVIQKANGTEYEVDADGFLIKKTLSDGAVWKYIWDAHGQLVEVVRPDKKKVLFTYDAFGRRTTKTFDDKTTEYVWDGDDLVHERVKGAAGEVVSPLTTWVFEPGTFTPLAKIEGRRRFGIVSDHLGSPNMLSTEAGEIAWRAQLDVYGVPREEEGVAEEQRTSNPWRFPGQYEDSETGLYYNRFRYYDAELGRYLSEDPIGLAGGVRPYAYVSDPTRLLDPLGLKACNINKSTKKKLLAKKPTAPGNWHMHHIVMEGDFNHWRPENRELVEKSRAILEKYGVDLQGDANVVWALNEGHSVEYAQNVLDRLSKRKSKKGVEKELSLIAEELG